jgi:transglutaminase-like putative cysteine protease
MILALVTLLSTKSWAIGFQPVSQEELKMTGEPQAPGAPAIILYRQVDRFDERNFPHEDLYYRVKILTEEGRNSANVEVQFIKDREDVVHINARSIRPDGTITNFGGQVFEKNIVKSRDVRYLAKTFTIPDVEVGSVIEYYYTVDFNPQYVWSTNWIVTDELFTKDAKFSLQPYNGSGQFNLRWSWHSLPPGAQPQQGSDRIVRMEAQNIPAFQREEYMPPDNQLKSSVIFIYEQGAVFEREPDKYWKSFGKEKNGQLENFIGKHKAMEDAVSQIVIPSDPPEVKLRKIYDRVQQIRNKSYELKRTEQEEKREKEKPVENVEELWKRGYGTGVQLTWLFLALARAAGFESYGCWVSSRGNRFFDIKTMESAELNSNVVLVKLNGKDTYFDPGAEFTPFGMLTWSETGTIGLRLDKDGGSWIVTALPASSESKIERNAKFKLTETGDLEGKLTLTFTGLDAMYQRLDERHADAVDRKKFLEDLVKDEIPTVASEADLTNKPDWDSSETPLVAEFDINIPGWVSGAGKRALFPVGIFGAPEKQIFERTTRVHEIYFRYPHQKIDDVTVELPLGWQATSVPAAQNDDKKIVSYTMKAESDKATLHVTRTLGIDVLLVEQKYYPALRAFFQQVRSGDEEQIVLQPGATTASN